MASCHIRIIMKTMIIGFTLLCRYGNIVLLQSIKQLEVHGYHLFVHYDITPKKPHSPSYKTRVKIADTCKSFAKKIVHVSRLKDMEDYRNEVEAMKTLCNKSHTNMIQYFTDGF